MMLPGASIRYSCFSRNCETRGCIRRNAEMGTTKNASYEKMFHYGRGASRSQSPAKKKQTVKDEKNGCLAFYLPTKKLRISRRLKAILSDFVVISCLESAQFPNKK